MLDTSNLSGSYNGFSSASNGSLLPNLNSSNLALSGSAPGLTDPLQHGSHFTSSSSLSTLNAGAFTVGATGQVSFDYLFDGGAYEGEVAIFSLTGMDRWLQSAPDFFAREAALRAISNSDLGHIVISDQTEGARFSGSLPYEGNFNAGSYLGAKTFSMRPGEQFGVMLVPNGTVEDVLLHGGKLGCDRLPLFSIPTLNSENTIQLSQLANEPSDVSFFSFEDLSLNGYSDRDYNDIIFQVRGAAGGATLLDAVVDLTKDWRDSSIGQEIGKFIGDSLDPAGNTIASALNVNIGSIDIPRYGWVGSNDTDDFYSFRLNSTSNFRLALNGLTADADVQVIRDANSNGMVDVGEILVSSTNSGGASEAIDLQGLGAGSYVVRVSQYSGNTSYTLNLAATPGLGIATEVNNTLNTAYDIGTLNGIRIFSGGVSTLDTKDFYRFNLGTTSNFSLLLNGLTGDADVEVIRDVNFNGLVDPGEVMASSNLGGSFSESISLVGLEAGAYFARVLPFGNAATNYIVNLTATPKAPADWTVMVYLDADNNLENFGIDDFVEMAAVGSTNNVNVVVQFDRMPGDDSRFGDWTDTRRGLVRSGDTPTQFWGNSLGEINMGDRTTLSSFVNWSMSNYQANNYALIVWNHGGGYQGIAWDDSTTTNDYLELNEVSGALSNLPDTIDILGTDACLMGMAEFAYQVRNNASILVASEELIPGAGWNYTTVLSDLTANSSMTANQLSTAMVKRYDQNYRVAGAGKNNETLSSIDLAALRSSNSLSTALTNFATTFMGLSTANDRTQLEAHRANSADFDSPNRPSYRDLGTILTSVVIDATMTAAVRTVAQVALNAYNTEIISNFSEISGRGTGLSINFQQRGTAVDGYYTSSNLSFAADTQWDEFLGWWQTA